MLALFIHFEPPDNVVHDSGISPPISIVLAVRQGGWLTVGEASVKVLEVRPAGIRLGFDAPSEVIIERDKVRRRRRRQSR